MNTVFIQKDEGFGVSFIWSEDISTLKNLLAAYHEDVLSFGYEDNKGDFSLAYKTSEFENIHSIVCVVFDRTVIIEDDTDLSNVFIKSCKEILNGQ